MIKQDIFSQNLTEWNLTRATDSFALGVGRIY